jgi:hypothetical protein
MHLSGNPKRHSLTLLNALYEYDSFLDGLRTIVDMGCGTGEDIVWWATLETRDDPPEPRNYMCYAVDKDPGKLSQVPDLENIYKIGADFTMERIIPVKKADLMMAHDSLQYSHNPVETLRLWNEQMNVNGMLIMSVPTHSGVEDNRYFSRGYNHCFHHFTPVNLIYMLAVNGFDCNDAYLLKKFNDPWINIAVYKSDVPPMDPRTTIWLDLINKGLVNKTVKNSVYKHGYLKQEELLFQWLDRENYYIDWIPKFTVIPEAAGEPTVTGIFNETVPAETSMVEQAKPTVKKAKILKPFSDTKLREPIAPMQPPKKGDL